MREDSSDIDGRTNGGYDNTSGSRNNDIGKRVPIDPMLPDITLNSHCPTSLKPKEHLDCSAISSLAVVGKKAKIYDNCDLNNFETESSLVSDQSSLDHSNDLSSGQHHQQQGHIKLSPNHISNGGGQRSTSVCINQMGGSYSNGKPLPLIMRQRIILMANRGFKASDISKELKVSHGCISKIINKFINTGSIMPGIIGGSKPKVATQNVINAICKMKSKTPCMFAWEIKEKLVESKVCDESNAPSVSSINRIIRQRMPSSSTPPPPPPSLHQSNTPMNAIGKASSQKLSIPPHLYKNQMNGVRSAPPMPPMPSSDMNVPDSKYSFARSNQASSYYRPSNTYASQNHQVSHSTAADSLYFTSTDSCTATNANHTLMNSFASSNSAHPLGLSHAHQQQYYAYKEPPPLPPTNTMTPTSSTPSPFNTWPTNTNCPTTNGSSGGGGVSVVGASTSSPFVETFNNQDSGGATGSASASNAYHNQTPLRLSIAHQQHPQRLSLHQHYDGAYQYEGGGAMPPATHFKSNHHQSINGTLNFNFTYPAPSYFEFSQSSGDRVGEAGGVVGSNYVSSSSPTSAPPPPPSRTAEHYHRNRCHSLFSSASSLPTNAFPPHTSTIEGKPLSSNTMRDETHKSSGANRHANSISSREDSFSLLSSDLPRNVSVDRSRGSETRKSGAIGESQSSTLTASPLTNSSAYSNSPPLTTTHAPRSYQVFEDSSSSENLGKLNVVSNCAETGKHRASANLSTLSGGTFMKCGQSKGPQCLSAPDSLQYPIYATVPVMLNAKLQMPLPAIRSTSLPLTNPNHFVNHKIDTSNTLSNNKNRTKSSSPMPHIDYESN